MNEIYHKSKGFLLRSLFFLAVVSSMIIVNSCRKDSKHSSQSATQSLVDNNVNINMLKTAYNKGINAGKLKLGDVSQQTLQSIIGSLNVDWTSYSLYTYPDSTQVIEFAMPDDTTLVTPGMPNVHDSLKYFTKTCAVFILRKDTINMSFFMKTVENGTAPDYQSVINYVHYQQIPTGFTGNVLYFTLGRQFINGYAWNNGYLSNTVSLGGTTYTPPTTVNKTGKLKPNTTEILPCTIYSYDVYEITTASSGGSTPVVTQETYLYTVSVAVCELPTDTDTGGSTSGTGGVSGGSPVPPKNPCSPAASTEAVISIKGHLEINVAQPITPAPGSPSTPPAPPPVPCPTTPAPKAPPGIKIVFCDGLTSAEQTSILNTITAFSTEDCASKFLYNYFSNKTFSFCINSSAIGNVNYNPVANSFTFSTDYAATPAFASLLEHEFFHAYQNATYTNGIAAYGKNASTGVGSPGFVNIEFEQAVFNDIVNHTTSAFNLGTSEQQTQYTAWISGLTDNGTIYPELSPSTPAYTQFITQYNSFLNQFNALPNNPYSSPVINLTPQAFINLFNSVTPNC